MRNIEKMLEIVKYLTNKGINTFDVLELEDAYMITTPYAMYRIDFSELDYYMKNPNIIYDTLYNEWVKAFNEELEEQRKSNGGRK